MSKCCANCFHFLARAQMCMKFEGMKPNPNYCCAYYESFKDKPKEAQKKCLTENSPLQNGDSRIAAALGTAAGVAATLSTAIDTVVDTVVEIFEGED